MKKTLTSHWHNLYYTLDRIKVIYGALERQTELEQLIKWAKRKKLTRPRKLYQLRLQDEEQRLATLGMRHPRLIAWCRCLRAAVHQIKGTSTFTKGSVAKYKFTRK